MYAFAVVDCHISPTYFWQEMSEIEYYYLIKRINKKRIEDFEPFRTLGFVVARLLGSDVDYDNFLNLEKNDNETVDNRTDEEIKQAQDKLKEIYIKNIKK